MTGRMSGSSDRFRPMRTRAFSGRAWFTSRPDWKRTCLFAISLGLIGATIVFPAPKELQARGASSIEALTNAGTTPEYHLAVLDTIRVHVYEWRPSKDEVYAWTALNREYKVGPSGHVVLPLVGQIPAVGVTANDLAGIIAERLRTRLDLAMAPDATVEIVAFRPIHVTGDVEKSGEVGFTPGMTVLQAVSLGGGLRQDKEPVGKLAREMISTSGELELLRRERAMLMARRARLEAELTSADFVNFPDDVHRVSGSGDAHHAAAFIGQEQRAFTGRRRANATQIKAITELKDHLEKEVSSLAKQLAVHDQQIELMQREFDGIKDLAQRRLATQPRLLGMQRNLAQLEGDRLRIQAALSRARQEAKRAAISLIELENGRTNGIITDLQQIEFRLDSVSRRAGTFEHLLVETVGSGVSTVADGGEEGTQVEYTIVRSFGEKIVSVKANETTRLEAGDIIKVRLPRKGMFLQMTPGGTKEDRAFPADTTEPLPTTPRRASIDQIAPQVRR